MAREFAPIREDGRRPYFVTVVEPGRSYDKVVYAFNVRDAVYSAKDGLVSAVVQARRATRQDMERFAA
jgi:hypothetical protein